MSLAYFYEMKSIAGVFSLIWKICVGILFALMSLLFFPVLGILVQKPKWHRAAFKGFVVWSWTFRFLCFYQVRKTQKETLGEGPYIFVSNHASYLDIFLFPSMFPNHPHLFLGKSEILSYPIIRTYFKNFNIPVFRNNRMKAAKSYIQSKKALKNNWSLVIFPEGGIPDWEQPRMDTFKDGAFRMAKDMGVAIVPITFVNNFRLFSDPTDWLGSAYPGISKVIVHPVISSQEVIELSSQELNDKCFQIINDCLMSQNAK